MYPQVTIVQSVGSGQQMPRLFNQDTGSLRCRLSKSKRGVDRPSGSWHHCTPIPLVLLIGECEAGGQMYAVDDAGSSSITQPSTYRPMPSVLHRWRSRARLALTGTSDHRSTIHAAIRQLLFVQTCFDTARCWPVRQATEQVARMHGEMMASLRRRIRKVYQ